MTRKDYEALAAALNRNFTPIARTDNVRDAIHSDYCNAVADALARDNARFDRASFLKACGVEA